MSEDLNRIRRLAGLPEIQVENAEDNDYAAELSSRKGEVYAGTPSRPGTARADTRPVPAKSGDNPLADSKSFKDYLNELMVHRSTKSGDLRPVLYSKYRGEEYSGWGVEQYQDTRYGGDWDMPDWFYDNPDLAGPFDSAEQAQQAIDAYRQSNESLTERKNSTYKMSTTLSFGEDGTQGYTELDVTFSYTVHWGSEETGRGYMADPYAYDPGSASEIENIAVLSIDGMDPLSYGQETIDAILSQLESGKLDADLLQNAAEDEESRRPDESIDEDARWNSKVNRYGPPMFLLPAGMNNTLDELEHNEYFGGILSAGQSSIVVVGKMNGSSGKFTPRYCSTHGSADYNVGDEVTVVHDQTHGTTPGKILYQFSGADYMQNRERVAQELESLGIPRNKKVPVKVFK